MVCYLGPHSPIEKQKTENPHKAMFKKRGVRAGGASRKPQDKNADGAAKRPAISRPARPSEDDSSDEDGIVFTKVQKTKASADMSKRKGIFADVGWVGRNIRWNRERHFAPMGVQLLPRAFWRLRLGNV